MHVIIRNDIQIKRNNQTRVSEDWEILGPRRMERPPENADRMVFFLKHELVLTEAQVREYHRSRLKHLEQIRQINHEIQSLKKELIDQLSSFRVDSQKVNLHIQLIGKNRK